MNVPLAFFVIVSTISGGIAAGGITSGTVVGICVSISIFSGFVALDIMIKRAAKNKGGLDGHPEESGKNVG